MRNSILVFGGPRLEKTCLRNRLNLDGLATQMTSIMFLSKNNSNTNQALRMCRKVFFFDVHTTIESEFLWTRPSSEVIKLFTYSIQRSRQLAILINIKMPAMVGNIIFSSMKK